jgi:hypothetical protein
MTVAWNILLDGNTWKESYSIDRKRSVADMTAGVAIIYKRLKLSYAHVYRTKEFDGQDQSQLFGSSPLPLHFKPLKPRPSSSSEKNENEQWHLFVRAGITGLVMMLWSCGFSHSFITARRRFLRECPL